MNIQEFYDELEKHDWFYAYSDDHRVWKKGADNRMRLLRLISENGEQFEKLYDDFAKYIWDKTEKPQRPTGNNNEH